MTQIETPLLNTQDPFPSWKNPVLRENLENFLMICNACYAGCEEPWGGYNGVHAGCSCGCSHLRLLGPVPRVNEIGHQPQGGPSRALRQSDSQPLCGDHPGHDGSQSCHPLQHTPTRHDINRTQLAQDQPKVSWLPPRIFTVDTSTNRLLINAWGRGWVPRWLPHLLCDFTNYFDFLKVSYFLDIYLNLRINLGKGSR